MTIRIRTIRAIEPRTVRRLVGRYTSTQRYVARRTASRGEVAIRVTKVDLARPFRKVFPLTREDWRRLRRVARLGWSLGAFDHEDLVGVVLVEPMAWNRSLWVWEIGVAETHRRRGIGSRLIEELARRGRVRGFRTIVCETQTPNVGAIDFYRANGFLLDGVDLTYYTNEDVARGEVALFMKRPLGPRKRPRRPRTSK